MASLPAAVSSCIFNIMRTAYRYVLSTLVAPGPGVRLERERVGDHRAPVELVAHVDRVVAAVGPDPEGAEQPAPGSELALLRERAPEEERPVAQLVVPPGSWRTPLR